MSLTHPDFDGCADATGASIPTGLRIGVVPAGAVDAVNKVFSTPDLFVHDGVTDERVYLRGQRLREGAANDYVASESGGVGTGYDTVTFSRAPRPGDNILVDYYRDV